MPAFSNNLTVRAGVWVSFKALVASKLLSVQYEDDGTTYTIWGYDGPEVHTCTIWKGSVPDSIAVSYSQATNDTDKADFETNYKPSANGPVVARTRDGRQDIRVTAAKRTTNFNLRVMSFYTSKADSVHNINPLTGVSFGDLTLTLQKWNAQTSAWVAATDTDAERTIIDWEPHYNYEIIGGFMDIPTSLKDGTSDAWYLSAIGVPDIPVQYGGSIAYISEVNLEAVTATRIASEGRAISYLPYQYGGTPGTNKLRFIVKHPVGQQKRFQLYIEHFI